MAAVALLGWGCDGQEPLGEAEEPPERPSDFADPASPIIPRVSAVVHQKVKTVIIVRWTQTQATLSTKIRYTFENDEWLETPATPRSAGEHEEVLLGIPEKSTVTFYFETDPAFLPPIEDSADGGIPDGGDRDGGAPDAGREEPEKLTATTGALPERLPRPTVLAYDPQGASRARWMLGSVEDTPGQTRYYTGPFWIYIMDREGRIVWYYSDLGENPCMAYPRIARDSSHLYIEKRMFHSPGSYDPKVARMTLDYRRFEEIPIPGLDDCIDVTDDGGILYNVQGKGGAALMERRPDGTAREIWSCSEWAKSRGINGNDHACYSNTVNWNPVDDTVLLSMPYLNTVLEIDRQTGRLLSQWGDLQESYRFEPSSWTLEFNHFPNITPDGTLLLSTHLPGHEDKMAVGEHRFAEFEIDRDRGRLLEKWVYGEGVSDWPRYKGEAERLDNGNTLVNCGTGGIIREVTPEKRTVWHVKWDADFPDDRFNKMVGHHILVNDLYALNRGW